MKSILILGKPGCMKCEDVKMRLFRLRDLGYTVEYRHATMKDIKTWKLTTAPVVFIKDDDQDTEILIEKGMTYNNILKYLES